MSNKHRDDESDRDSVILFVIFFFGGRGCDSVVMAG